MSRIPRPLILRLAAGAAGVAAALVVAAPASAHVTAQPPQITAGAAGTITLTVEEGCGTSPTAQLAVKLPAAFGAASTPTGPEGWTGEQSADVLTFSGPPMAADAPFTVAFTVTPDASVGGTIQPLLAVQTCVKGVERWIDQVIAGQPEPDHPTALVTVLPAPTTTTVATTAAPTTVATTAAPTTEAATTSAPTTVAPTTVAPTTATSLAPVVAPAPPADGSSGSTIAAVVGVVVAVSAAGGYLLARRRKPGAPTAP